MVKLTAIGGLSLLGTGALMAGYGAFDESLRWIGAGVTLGFIGLGAEWTVAMLASRRQLRSLDQIRWAGGGGTDGLVEVIREEIDEVVRVVDSRILGLFEVLAREQGPGSQGAE